MTTWIAGASRPQGRNDYTLSRSLSTTIAYSHDILTYSSHLMSYQSLASYRSTARDSARAASHLKSSTGNRAGYT